MINLDVRDFDQYDAFSKKVESIVGQDGLNVLFNNAGVSSKFTRIQLVKHEQMLEAFKVNTIAPVMLTKVSFIQSQNYLLYRQNFKQALFPLLKRASEKNPSKPVGAERAIIVNTTSVLGSIALNSDGGLYPYRCSKVTIKL